MHDVTSATSVSSGLLYTLRVLVFAHAASLLVAAMFAGQALVFTDTGIVADLGVAETHVMIGMVSHLIGLLQVVAAVLYWRPGRGAGWPALASLALLLLGFAQHFLLAIGLGAHVPNGVLMFGLLALITVWAWSPAASRRR
ncbi:hypothetical protein [Nonomuraea africana]|uniref:DUF4383 domain-containing protein n=1 Tax=Nonomuraea africana TaxID=46171 RepID=A0ABR9KEG0_9ACTN|nr:hypothetical protein [Nonomuraea africana]MBE1560423.1 hypothetical protein [Nonomuraea africana]